MSKQNPTITFSTEQRDPHQGSVGIASDNDRGLLYFYADPFIGEVPEHTGEDRRAFETFIREEAEKHWRILHPEASDVRSLRINYGYRWRNCLAKIGKVESYIFTKPYVGSEVSV